MTALPAFSVTGNLFEILASIADDEIEVQSWQSAILHFESNITKGVLVWDGVVYSRPPAVTVNVGSDGAIATAEEPILLLASDPGLGLENLQWRVSIRVKGRLVASWSFAAAEDGETVDLADVAPVASTTATQILRGPAGPAGRSVDNITLDDDELVFAMSTAPDHRVQIPALDDAASAASIAQFAAGVAQGHAAEAQGYAADAQGYATDAQNAADTATNAAGLAEGHAETAAEAALEATNAVADAIEDLVGGAPNTLDTLQELANALGNDPNFATTITNLIANKQAKFMTGTCATATGTAAKTVTLDSPWASHTPAAGDFFLVTFTNGSSAAAPTLAINGSTARAIRSPNNGTAASQVQVSAGAALLFYFDGTYMQLLGVTHNSTYGEIAEADITNASGSTTGLVTGRRAEALLASEASKARTLTNKTISGADNALSNINADSLVDGTTNKAFTATEKTKLAGIEAGADVTDAANVAAAGAVMATSTALRTYVTNENGVNIVVPFGNAPSGTTMVMRDPNGRTQFADPAASGDAATKNYVDNGLAGKADSSHSHSISSVTGLQSALDGKASVDGSATGIWMGSTLPDTGTAGVLYVVVE